MFKKAGVKTVTNPSHELRKSKVGKFQKDLESISKMIDTTMNPFAETLMEDTNLYGLADGKKSHTKLNRTCKISFFWGRHGKMSFSKAALRILLGLRNH